MRFLREDAHFSLKSRVFRVQNDATPADANSFYLEGEDSTLYDTFASGTAKKVTFGTTMTSATGLTASGGDYEFIDVTTIHDSVRKQIPGLAAAGVYTFESIWDPADAALVAFKAAADNQALRAARITFSGGEKVLFNAYVGATLLPTGQAQDKVITSVVLTMFGRPTIYAS